MDKIYHSNDKGYLTCSGRRFKFDDETMGKIEAVHCNVVFRSDYKGDFDYETDYEIDSLYTKKKV